MPETTILKTLADAEDMADFARLIARHARGGDVFLLSGEIGAGKTTFARAFIKALLGPDEDVPSPTFTLVQTYPDANADIWHADLYRLTDPQEVVELGLTDAFNDAICLIEWPELLGGMTPKDAINCQFEVRDDHHSLTMNGPADRLAQLVAE